jgi:hypothetical protein
MRDGKRVGMCALLILSASGAQAADRGFYFGASGGHAKYDFDLPAPVAVIGGGFIPGNPQPLPIRHCRRSIREAVSLRSCR